MRFLLLEARELLGDLSVVNLFYPCLNERLKQLYAVESSLDSPSIYPSVVYRIYAPLYVDPRYEFLPRAVGRRRAISVYESPSLCNDLARLSVVGEFLSIVHEDLAECLLGSLE